MLLKDLQYHHSRLWSQLMCQTVGVRWQPFSQYLSAREGWILTRAVLRTAGETLTAWLHEIIRVAHLTWAWRLTSDRKHFQLSSSQSWTQLSDLRRSHQDLEPCAGSWGVNCRKRRLSNSVCFLAAVKNLQLPFHCFLWEALEVNAAPAVIWTSQNVVRQEFPHRTWGGF